MKVSKRGIFDQTKRLCKFFVRLTGESHHHIRADRGIFYLSTNSVEQVRVIPRLIRAAHRAQNTR